MNQIIATVSNPTHRSNLRNSLFLGPLLRSATLLTLVSGGTSLPAMAVTPFPPATANSAFNGTPITEIPQQDYTLGPGDRIKVDVLKAPQYTLDTQVLVDGTLSFVQVGRLNVQGLTIAEATEQASLMYGKLLRYPVVTLTLVSPRPIKVAVTGEVSRRGSYDLTGAGPENNSTPTQFPTLTRALKIAGGITQSADLKRVLIRRPQRGGQFSNISVNLWDFLRNGDNRQDAILRDGDTIVVPTAEMLDLKDSYQLATTSFSAEKVQPLNITVFGEVYRPGTHTVESSVTVPLAGNPGQARDSFNQARIFPTLTRALQSAGGIKSMANVRDIQVRRVTQSGTEQTFKIDLWALLKEGDQKQDLILQDRDTIFVPLATARDRVEASTIASATFSPDKIRVSVIGEIERPGFLELPPNVPLTRAIIGAGGFNKRANRNTVEFIRLNPDGSILKRDVPVNFAAAVDDQTNPTLQNEDVIVVRRSGLSIFGDSDQITNPVSGIISVIRSILFR
jgi:polysaccharide biosynthesis/export protein